MQTVLADERTDEPLRSGVHLAECVGLTRNKTFRLGSNIYRVIDSYEFDVKCFPEVAVFIQTIQLT